jgi:hypothetical protein
LLNAIAAFAETFVNPLAPILAFAAALVLHRAAAVRLTAAAIGGAMALLVQPGLAPAELGLSVAGAAAAMLLHAEIMVHLAVPFLRWCLRCLRSAWELARLALAVLLRLPARTTTDERPGPDRGP